MLVLDERDGHQDLHGLSRRSVIPYVHNRKRVILPKRWLFLSVVLSGLEHSNARYNLL
jgi:hypothetical protein